MKNDREKLKILLPEIKTNVLLKNYTTFKIGGKAKYFFAAKTKENLIKAVKAAKENKLLFFILAGGSNILVSDKSYQGFIIKIQNTKYKIQNTKIIAEAGVTLKQLANVTASAGLMGIEWAVGIPGTIGGAIRGNAGAFGKSIKEAIKEVEVFDAGDEKIKLFQNKDCKFKYRDNIFKQNSNLIILSAIFKLKKRNKKALQEKIKNYLIYRKENHPLNFPSAGSVFKNCELRITDYELLKKYPEIKEFNKIGKVPAGWLIEKCGLKGKKINNVKISEKHCNFIVNLGGGKAKDVIALIKSIKQRVKNKFKIILEEEIQFL